VSKPVCKPMSRRLACLSLCVAGFLVALAGPAAAQMTTGTYVGNGTAGRRITGLGFKPDVVLIKGKEFDGAFTPTSTVMRTSTMPAGLSKLMVLDNALIANHIQSLDVDGFTVGTDRRVNQAGIDFFWAAFKVDPDMKVGSYTGNGGSQSITGLGFSPDYVIVMSATDKRAIHACSVVPTASPSFRSYEFESAGWIANEFTSLDALGFSVTHNAGAPYANESGVTYHYVAWNAAPLKTFVSSYPGNAVNDRNITGVGFQPEYLIVKPIYNNNVSPNLTPPPMQRMAQIAGDSTMNFSYGLFAPDHIQALQTDGFQIGAAQSINRAFAECNADGGVGCSYFYVAFNLVAPDSPPLGTTQGAGTLTVTAPNSFEMVFTTNASGGIEYFHDLAEDPGRALDLVGGTTDKNAMFFDSVELGFLQNYSSYGPNTGTMHLLEATPTRVRVRQDAFYRRLLSTVILPGLRGFGDYSVYPSGRLALRWERRATSGTSYQAADVDLCLHRSTPPALNNWNASSQSGNAFPIAGGTDDFILAKIDVPTARTDFLQILDRDWTAAGGHASTADQMRWSPGAAAESALLQWRETTNPYTIPANSSEIWNFLTYFKPTNLGSTPNPWQDPLVTVRATDYRSPDPLSAIGPGTGWNENTADADFFNESEAAYTFDLNPATGLTFDMDGFTTTRFDPFFKIRQWRSVVGPPSVTLEGTPLVRDVDYRADVKPVSRAHFAQSLRWHSTLQDSAAVSVTPDLGSPGSVTGLAAVDFVAARFGSGARISNSGQYVAFDTTDFDPAKGAVEFWYQPSYANNDGALHDICGFVFDASHLMSFEKRADNNLYFRFVNGLVSEVRATTATYSWRINDWVHIRLEWDDSQMVSSQMRIVLNGSPIPSDVSFANDYNSAGLSLAPLFRFGNSNGDADFAAGLFDEIHLYGGSSTTPTPFAKGGLTSPVDASEYLADTAKNFPLAFAGVDATRRGEYAYLGTDSQFRGLNVVLSAAGAGVAAGAIVWEYWNGTTGAWAVGGFTDQTNSFTKNGTVLWTSDPAGWAPYSVNGGPELYYVRAHLAMGESYSTSPVEDVITTDILLFQYNGDITASARTFSFAPPVPTAVRLLSFEAWGVNGAVELTWQTGSELDNLGFHVYRSSSDAGPWTRITTSLIPGLGSSPTGARYSLRDPGLVNGTRYFYRLEDVDASSKTTSHGPVSAVPIAATADSAGNGGDASDGTREKRKGADFTACPDWVLAAYGSSVGSSSLTSLRCTRHGDPEAVSLDIVARDSRSATLELRTGGFYALHEPSGGVRVFVPGFDFPQDLTAAALPFRRALVDAVVGRGVKLGGVRALDQVGFPGLVPSALGKPEMQVSWDGTVRASRRGVRALSPQRFSTDLAQLLPSVFQGETKSAVVQISPLRVDARRRQLLLAKRVRLQLLFVGRETGESGRGSVGRAPWSRKPVVSREILARLYTKSLGLQAVSFDALFPGQNRGLAASSLRLERQGQAQRFHLEPASDSVGPGSVLYFHADTTAGSSDFSSETAWELVRSGDGVAMPLVAAAPAGNEVSSASTRRASFETNRFYQPGLLDAPDLWLWEGLASGATRTTRFALTGPDAAGAQTAELDVVLQGASESGNPVDHHVSVSLNGAPVGEAQFAGKRQHRMSLVVPASLLREGTNELSLTNVPDTGVSSFVFLDRFTLSYPQTSSLAGGVFEGTWNESGTVTLAGLTAPARLLDVTAVGAAGGTGGALWLTGHESTAGSLRFRAEAGHRYLAVSAQALLTPRVATPEPSTLRSAQNQADYLLIAPRAFLSPAEPLLERRRAQGLQVRAVSFEEISDEFGHGQPTAEAIKSFLGYAFHSWARPSPRYVLLLGDSSYDPRNFTGTSRPSPLPALWTKTSYLWTVSDPRLAAVNGEDALPDLAIGRLPAASVDEAGALVEKLIAWEDSGQGLNGAAALVADNPDLAGDFEADVRDIAENYLAGRNPQLLLLSELGSQARPRILDALNSGLGFLNYVGHGGAAVWASENVWNSWDAASLQAQSQQPLLVTMNCLNGYFVVPAYDSLAESLLKAEGRGAIASFSPSGLSVDGPAHQYHRALMAELTSGQHERLGDAVLAAQKTFAETGLMPELLSIYHLLGDPATALGSR